MRGGAFKRSGTWLSGWLDRSVALEKVMVPVWALTRYQILCNPPYSELPLEWADNQNDRRRGPGPDPGGSTRLLLHCTDRDGPVTVGVWV